MNPTHALQLYTQCDTITGIDLYYLCTFMEVRGREHEYVMIIVQDMNNIY